MSPPALRRATTMYVVKELLIATNPDEDSRLAYLVRVPLGEGIVLRTAATWPRIKALYGYQVPALWAGLEDALPPRTEILEEGGLK